MLTPDPPPRSPCPACGERCTSLRDCFTRGRVNGRQATTSRRLVLTELGWARSKYGRDPRGERRDG